MQRLCFARGYALFRSSLGYSQDTKLNSENMLLFIAVAGELGFSSFDSVTHAIAFNEKSREMISNHSIKLSALNYTRLNETIVKDFATSNVIFNFICVLQILLQT